MNGMEGLRRKMDPVPAGRCLLGVSGGADSVALLVLLAGALLFRERLSRRQALGVCLILAALAAARLLLMATTPVFEPSEARSAAISRRLPRS